MARRLPLWRNPAKCGRRRAQSRGCRGRDGLRSRRDAARYTAFVNTASYIFPLFIANRDGALLADAGTAFAVAPDGGVITCRHVVDPRFSADDDRFLAIVDRERGDRVIPVPQIRYSSDATLDLAFLPDALQRSKRDFLPILDPEQIMIALEVRAIGYFGQEPGVTDVGAFVRDRSTQVAQPAECPFRVIRARSSLTSGARLSHGGSTGNRLARLNRTTLGGQRCGSPRSAQRSDRCDAGPGRHG
jgi:Trypsin-like peptidase domain